MPRGDYKKLKAACPKCARFFFRKGFATHVLHCKGTADSLLTRQLKESLATQGPPKMAQINKGIELFNKSITEHGPWTANAVNTIQDIAKTPFTTGTGYLAQPVVPFEELRKKYEQLSTECEGLRRVIGSQKETIDTLCRAMIEINAVEGRWR